MSTKMKNYFVCSECMKTISVEKSDDHYYSECVSKQDQYDRWLRIGNTGIDDVSHLTIYPRII